MSKSLLRRCWTFSGVIFGVFSLISLTAASALSAEQYTALDDGSTTPIPAHSLINDPEMKDWIYFGGNIGFATLSIADGLRESPKSGFQLNLKVLYSKYLDNWVLDIGGGYFYNHITGDDRYSRLLNPRVRVRTRAGLIEFSPRYRLDQNWQIGPVLNVLVGPDVSFDESNAPASEAFHVLVGPRGQYEIPMGKGRWRFGAQVLTDVTIPSRQLWLVQADVQYGIPFGGDGSSPTESTSSPSAPVERPPEPQFAEITEDRNVKIYLGETLLRFPTARYDLRPSAREVLAKMARYLAQAGDKWKSMRIEGHTDKRGALAYNDRLAVRRAEVVRRELASLGIPENKMTVKGFGPRKPIDRGNDLEAYALNRRVELWLDGVSQPEVLIRNLNELK